jgi:hypothetical protein
MYKLCVTLCSADWCTSFAALCVLQTDLQVVHHCVFFRLMYKLCSTVCSADWCTSCAALCVLQIDVQVVQHFVFCRLKYNLGGTVCSADWSTSCSALFVLQTEVQVVRHFVFCRLICTQSNKNQAAWNFWSPALEATWRAAATVIRVVRNCSTFVHSWRFSVFLSLQSFTPHIYWPRHQYVCSVWS